MPLGAGRTRISLDPGRGVSSSAYGMIPCLFSIVIPPFSLLFLYSLRLPERYAKHGILFMFSSMKKQNQG